MFFKQLLAFFIFPHLLFAQANKELFVSTDGNDNWEGTEQHPFRTIHKAKKYISEGRYAEKQNVDVFVKGGIYSFNKPLVFANADGGTDKFIVKYSAYKNEKVVLTGGINITGWSSVGRGIYRASVKDLNFRNLYVNGMPATRARYPNMGNYFRLKGWDLRDRSLIMGSDVFENWNHSNDVEAILQMYWAESIVHIKNIRKKSDSLSYVKVNDKEEAILFPRPYPQKQADAAFHLENALDFLDKEFEWFLDSKNGFLYFMPPVGTSMDKLSIVAPVVENLITIIGSAEAPVKNLLFKGFVFENTTWNLPSSNGYINAQAGMYNLSADSNNNQNVRRPISAINIQNAKHVVFKENIFRCLGATGIDLIEGTSNCNISGNIIRDIGGNGIMAGAFTSEPDGEYHVPFNISTNYSSSFNDTISNNYISRTGFCFPGTCGIAAGYTNSIKIFNNEIFDLPFTGISVGYGWTAIPNAAQNNFIAYNDISNVVNILSDGGGIYTLSLQPGTKIIGNYVHDIKRSSTAGSFPIGAVYLDEQSGGTMISPFIVESNAVVSKDPTVPHFHLHREGMVLFKYNVHNPTKEILSKVGIQQPYLYFINSNK